MKIRCTQIVIDRDPMTKIAKTVWPWEVAIFRSALGDAKIQIVGAVEVETAELPDAREEQDRLRQEFGIEPDTKQSQVDLVYGRGEDGRKKLEEAINASKGGDPEAAQKIVDGKGKQSEETVKAREEAYRDPITGEKIEDFAKVRPSKKNQYEAPAALEGKHSVTISSSAPIKATNDAGTRDSNSNDPLAAKSRSQIEAESRVGYAQSEAAVAAEGAKAAQGRADGQRAGNYLDSDGYHASAAERAESTTTRTTKATKTTSGKAAKSGKKSSR